MRMRAFSSSLAPGLPVSTRSVHSEIRGSSSAGQPISSRNRKLGRGWANSEMNSTESRSMKRSIRVVAICRIFGSRAFIRLGLNSGPSSWRHSVWSGGSISSGMYLPGRSTWGMPTG